jgi:hypothetical protein
MLYFLGGNWSASAYDKEGIDLYVEACLNHGRNFSLFFSGIAEFNIDETEFNNNLAIAINKYHARIIFKGNDPGTGKRLLNKTNIKDNKSFIYLYNGNVSKEKTTTVYSYDSSSPGYVVSQTKFTIPEFMKFGRIQGDDSWSTILGLLNFNNKDKFCFDETKVEVFKNVLKQVSRDYNTYPFHIDREEKYDFGKGTASIIISRDENKKIKSEYWVDSLREYICPIIKFYDIETSKLVSEYISSEYFQEKNTLLWYPKRYTEKKFDRLSGFPLFSVTYVLNPDTFCLNTDIQDNEFFVEIPKDAIVLDDRKNPVIRRYLANNSRKFLLSDCENSLDLVEWLTFDSTFKNPQYKDFDNDTPILPNVNKNFVSELFVRIVLFGIGFLIVLFSILYKIFVKKS